MRRGEVDAQGGYDGEYGVIRLFTGRGRSSAGGSQAGLFTDLDEAGAALTRPGAAFEPGMARAGRDDPGRGRGRHKRPPLMPQTRSPALDGGQQSFFDLDAGLEPEAPAGQMRGFTVPVAALLGGLNEAQREAVRCVDRPVVISAGPGTGKTRTLTHRIAYLVLQNGVRPESILAITFTNKAADEMAERLAALLGPRAAAITVKTFHAFAAALLREYGSRIGIDPRFTICSEDDRAVLLRLACPELSQSEQHATLAGVSDAKNRLQAPEAARPGDWLHRIVLTRLRWQQARRLTSTT